MLQRFVGRSATERRNKKNRKRLERGLRFEGLERRELLAAIGPFPTQGGTPDYYNDFNWAYSPLPQLDAVGDVVAGTGVRKFVDGLPGLYFTAATAAERQANVKLADNDLIQGTVTDGALTTDVGQYIPVAVPDTTTYPGSDYYEIEVDEYTEQMHSDLDPTKLWGYRQLNTTDPFVNRFNYLGPTIVATKDRPVRIKFINNLPTGAGGELFLPVDTTMMGAGAGPIMIMPMGATATYDNATDLTTLTVNLDPAMPMAMGEEFQADMPIILEGFTPATYNGEARVKAVNGATQFVVELQGNRGDLMMAGTVAQAYTDNRATLHLHGGDNPWVSDGTQHQWITPAGEFTNYDKGASAANVPDMADPGDGSMTFFWPNQQSSRLMFYHDHAFGITRLNVYAGEAAGYVLLDDVETQLIADGILPGVGIPLIIQDKTFIDPTDTDPTAAVMPQILTTDPTWPIELDDARNDLWYPHVYVPNQDPNTLDGVNAFGRWDYGPWIWPPFPVEHLPINEVTSVLVTNGGSGYTNPTVVITPEAGGTTLTPAAATANVVGGVVTSITVTNPGSYEGKPTVTITDPTGTGAALVSQTYVKPNLPDVSAVGEAFMDTTMINGTVYPYLDVDPKAYRFRILNASNDRFFNLQLQKATTIVSRITLSVGGEGSGYTKAPRVMITPAPGDTTGIGATAQAILEIGADGKPTGKLASIQVMTVGSQYTLPPIVTIAPPNATPKPGDVTATATAEIYTSLTEVGMVPSDIFQPNGDFWPAGWPTPDGRDGGIPDPRNVGPQMVQIGTEGGFLPAPVYFDNIPIGWDRDPKSATVGNVLEHNVFLGCAERADVIVDFSAFAGQTLILYNDAPAAVPARDPRYDYYTADADQTANGGAPSTLPGYGPNVRTLMLIRVSNAAATPYNFAALDAAFATTKDPVTGVETPGVFARSQDPIIVPQDAYNSAYGLDGVTSTFPSQWTAYERIHDTSLTFQPLNLATAGVGDVTVGGVQIANQNKAIIEEWNTDWGRMQSFLGVEVPFTNALNQTSLWFTIQDPVTEILKDTGDVGTLLSAAPDGTQIWKITHNGVDTHPIHFHLFNVQVINRVDWGGVVKPPEPNELGWKDTVRMNPLEDAIVALRPKSQKLPFGLPDSIRLLDPTMPEGSPAGFKGWDANGNPVTVTNTLTNFGWEYVWHCHILAHEEMDMMRPVEFDVTTVAPAAPVLAGGLNGTQVDLSWTDGTPGGAPATLGNPANEVGFRIERAAIDPATGAFGNFTLLTSVPANTIAFSDTGVGATPVYKYRVVAFNAYTLPVPPPVPLPPVDKINESFSNEVAVNPGPAPTAPSTLVATLIFGPQASLTWTDTATNETGFVIERSSDNGATFTPVATAPAKAGTGGSVTFVDPATLAAGATYQYRVFATRGTLTSGASPTATLPVPAAPAAPSLLTATFLANATVTPAGIRLTFRDNQGTAGGGAETGFLVERSVNGGAFALLTTLGPRTGTGNVIYDDTTVAAGNAYAYRVRAYRVNVPSAYSGTATVGPLAALTAPSNFAGATTVTSATRFRIALTWTDNSTNERRFVIQRATDAAFTTGLSTSTVGASAGTGAQRSLTQTGLTRGTSYYFRIRAENANGLSAWVNLGTFPVLVP